MKKARLKLKHFFSLSLTTFILLMLIFLALPAVLLFFQVPSFDIGEGIVWILRWKNEADESGISFNFSILIIIAIAVGLLGLFKQSQSHL